MQTVHHDNWQNLRYSFRHLTKFAEELGGSAVSTPFVDEQTGEMVEAA